MTPNGQIGRRNRPASLADQNGLTPFDRKERYEEQAQVVIDPFEACLSEAANRAEPLGILHRYRPGLDPANEEEHPPPRLISPVLARDVYHNSDEVKYKDSG
jgi:hypothetical protein